uniref:Polynucleotide adenylyltransferase n=1 Tax=Globodera rostochiensis TaxID=31243 RepID=A0A914IFA0_GLORO
MLFLLANVADCGEKMQKEKQKMAKNVQIEKNALKYGTNGGGEQSKTFSENAAGGIIDKKNRQCPKKGSSSANWNVSEDPLGVESVKILIEYLRRASGEAVQRRADVIFRKTFIVWFLKQNVGEMLNFAHKSFQLNGLEDQFEPIIDRSHWEELLEQYMELFGLNNSEWDNLLRKLQIQDAIQMNHSVDCDDPDNVAKIFLILYGQPTIHTIFEYNIGNFLKMYEQLRHFFCHEIEPHTLKTELALKLLSPASIVNLEDEFPEILRIDIMFIITINERCRRLLMNRSDSELYSKTYTYWAMGWLIGELRQVCGQVDRTQKVLSAQAVAALHKRVDDECAIALDKMMSERQMCVLERLLSFLNNVTAKDVRTFEKRIKKLTAAGECSDGKRRADTLDQFKRGSFARTIVMFINTTLLQTGFHSQFLQLVRISGAKTRLFKLLGNSTERLAELKDGRGQLRAKFYEEDVFSQNDHLRGHYVIALADDDGDWFRFNRTLAADVVVFMRWMKRELGARRLGAVYDQIRIHIDEHIYDPLFDMNTEELKKSEKFLRKMFFETKILLAMASAEGTKEMFCNKWKKIVGNETKTNLSNEQLKEERFWMAQLHFGEFIGLIEAAAAVGHDALIYVLKASDNVKVKKRLSKFVDEHAILEIFRRLSLNQHETRLYPVQRLYTIQIEMFSDDEQNASDSEEAESENNNNNNNNEIEHLNAEKTEKEEESVSEKEQYDEKEKEFVSEKEQYDEKEEESVREEEQNEEKEEESVREEEQNEEKEEESVREEEQNEEKEEESVREEEQNEEKEEESVREEKQNEEKEEDSDWQSDENAEEYLKKVMGNATAPSAVAAAGDGNQQKLITCPPKSVSVEMLRYIDKENNADFLHFLSVQCMEYLSNHFEQIRSFKDGGQILKADELKPLENDQNRKEKLHLEVAKLRGELAQLMDVTKNNEQEQQLVVLKALELRLFNMYKFVKRITFNKQFMENSSGWHQIIQQEINMEMLNNVMSDSDEDEMPTIYMELFESEQLFQITFLFIYNLLDRFTELQKFFCDLSGVEQREKVQAKLELAFGEHYLHTLEELAPEIMKFDMPSPQTMATSFKYLLYEKVGTDQFQIAEARLSIPCLLRNNAQSCFPFMRSFWA